MEKKEYLTDEFLKNWTKKYCLSKEEIDFMKDMATYEARVTIVEIITPEAVLNNEETILPCDTEKLFRRSKEWGFAYAIDILGKRFADNHDFSVRYAKPSMPDGTVVPQVIVVNEKLIAERKEAEKEKSNQKSPTHEAEDLGAWLNSRA